MAQEREREREVRKSDTSQNNTPAGLVAVLGSVSVVVVVVEGVGATLG